MPILLLILFYWIFKNWQNASILASFLLLTYFFLPSFIIFIRTIPVLNVLGKYSVMFSLTLIIFVSFIYNVLKKRKVYLGLGSFLSLCFSILLITEGISFLIKINTEDYEIRTGFRLRETPMLQDILSDSLVLPDIYYLIFDELGSPNSMNILYDSLSKRLDEGLKENGFFVSRNAISCTDRTETSMLGILNMSTIELPENAKVEYRRFHTAKNQINNNILIPFLEKNNYKIINASIFTINNKHGLTKPYYWSFQSSESMITNQTLWRHFYKSSGWILQNQMPSLFKKYFPNDPLIDTAIINEAIQKIDTALSDLSTYPRFLYAHFFIPHAPVKYNADGSVRVWKNFLEFEKGMNNAVDYKSQLKFTLLLLDSVIQKIRKFGKKNSVIIIQGDHGFRNYNNKPWKNEYMLRPYNAIYFPDKDYSVLTDTFFTPNTFRVVLNKYFKQNLSLLHPKTTLITLENL